MKQNQEIKEVIEGSAMKKGRSKSRRVNPNHHTIDGINEKDVMMLPY
jgi:hypothetical protein